MIRYYDKTGTPIDVGVWQALFSNKAYQRVALTETEGYDVSTVWLGLNHQWGEGPPLIFETMVFLKKPDGHDFNEQDMDRYSTVEEALAGHQRIVERWHQKTQAAFADALCPEPNGII